MYHALSVPLVVVIAVAAGHGVAAPPEGGLVLRGTSDPLDVAIDPRGRWVATVGMDGLALYALPTRALVRRAPFASGHRIDFVADGEWLLVNGAGFVDPRDLDGPAVRPLEHELTQIAVARRAPTGIVFAHRALALARVGRNASGRVEWIPRHALAIDEHCHAVAIDDDGKTAVAACQSKWYVFDVARATSTSFQSTTSLDVSSRLWVGKGGRVAAFTKNGERELVWVDLDTGATRVLDVTSKTLAALHGSPPRLLYVDWKRSQIVAERFDGTTEVRGSSLGSLSRFAYDDALDVIVRHDFGGGLSLFDGRGRPIGALTPSMAPIDHVCSSRDERVTVRLKGLEGITDGVVILDLARATSRRRTTTDPPEACAISGGQAFSSEPSSFIATEGSEQVVLAGLDPTTKITASHRSGDRWVVLERGDELGVVDLQARKLVHWVRRSGDAKLTHAYVDDLGRWLLTLADDRTTSTYDLAKGRHVGTSPTPWSATDTIHLVTMTGDETFVSTFGALYYAKRPGQPLTVMPSLPSGVSAIRSLARTNRLVMEIFGTLYVCKSDGSKECWSAPGSAPFSLADDTRLAAIDAHGGLVIYDVATGKPDATLYLSSTIEPLITTSDGDYMGAGDAFDLARWATGSDVDLLDVAHGDRNRPSRVLAALGHAPPARIAALAEAESRRYPTRGARADRSLLIDVPPASTDNATLATKVRLVDGDRVHALVNGIPVFGAAGWAPSATPSADPAALPLPLSPGENRVVLYARSGDGTETRSESFIVTSFASLGSEGLVYVLGAGVSDYTTDARDLAYAADDVRAAARAFEALRPGRVRSRVRVDGAVTRDALLEARAFLAAATPADTVIVYLAGHGLLAADGGYVFATADTDFASPEHKGFRFDDLNALLDGLAAGQKLVFIDSCHAGNARHRDWSALATAQTGTARGTIKVRGARANRSKPKATEDLALDALVENLAGDLRRDTGATIVVAAAAGEVAFESETVKGGLFTHALVRSLGSGAARRKDGTVWIEDLVTVVKERVAALSGGAQRAQVRAGNPSFRRPLATQVATRVHKASSRESAKDVAVSPARDVALIRRKTSLERISLATGHALGPVTPWADERCRDLCDMRIADGGRRFLVKAQSTLYAWDSVANVMKVIATDLVPFRDLASSSDGRWVAHCGETDLVLRDLVTSASAAKTVSLQGGLCHGLSWDDGSRSFSMLLSRLVGEYPDTSWHYTLGTVTPETGSRTEGPPIPSPEGPADQGAWPHLSADRRRLYIRRDSIEAMESLRAFDTRTGGEIDLARGHHLAWVEAAMLDRPRWIEGPPKATSYALIYDASTPAPRLDIVPGFMAPLGGLPLVPHRGFELLHGTELLDGRTGEVLDGFVVPDTSVDLVTIAGDTIWTMGLDGDIYRYDRAPSPGRPPH